MTFLEWCDLYLDLETFVGINQLSHRDISNRAWTHQQQYIDQIDDKVRKLETDNKILIEAIDIALRARRYTLSNGITEFVLDENDFRYIREALAKVKGEL